MAVAVEHLERTGAEIEWGTSDHYGGAVDVADADTFREEL
jgi:hypothetical protein